MTTVPAYQEYMNPLLAVLRRHAVAQALEEIDRLVSQELGLAPEIATVPHDPERPDRSEVAYRIAWARTYLKKAGLLVNPKRGRWGISEKGKTAGEIDSYALAHRDRGHVRVEVIVDREQAWGGRC